MERSSYSANVVLMLVCLSATVPPHMKIHVHEGVSTPFELILRQTDSLHKLFEIFRRRIKVWPGRLDALGRTSNALSFSYQVPSLTGETDWEPM